MSVMHSFSLLADIPLYRVTFLGETIWQFPKTLEVRLSHDPAIPLLDTYPEKRKQMVTKTLCKNVHGSFILINPRLGATQMFTYSRMITMWNIHTGGTLLGNKKEQCTETCYKVNGSQKHHDE